MHNICWRSKYDYLHIFTCTLIRLLLLLQSVGVTLTKTNRITPTPSVSEKKHVLEKNYVLKKYIFCTFNAIFVN